MVTFKSLSHQINRERRSTEKSQVQEYELFFFGHGSSGIPISSVLGKKHRILNKIQLRLISSMCRTTECAAANKAQIYIGLSFCFIFKIIVVFSQVEARWEETFGCCHKFYEWVSVLCSIDFYPFHTLHWCHVRSISYANVRIAHARIILFVFFYLSPDFVVRLASHVVAVNEWTFILVFNGFMREFCALKFIGTVNNSFAEWMDDNILFDIFSTIS